jgi:hypothetical protein
MRLRVQSTQEQLYSPIENLNLGFKFFRFQYPKDSSATWKSYRKIGARCGASTIWLEFRAVLEAAQVASEHWADPTATIF